MIYIVVGMYNAGMLMSGVPVSVISAGVNVKRVGLQRHECEDETDYPRFFKYV